MIKKIVQIHTDRKFLYESEFYKSDTVENQIIFVGEDNGLTERYGDSIQIFPKIEESIPQIIDIIKESDLILLCELCDFKVKLLEKIPLDKKVLLRLFGYELYRLKRNQFISNETRKSFFPIRKDQSITRNLKNLIHQYHQKPTRFDSEKQKKIFDRLNAIIMVNEFEYSELKKSFTLPKFIKLNLPPVRDNFDAKSSKENLIIIGNSKHFWNNHIDILKLLRRVNNIKNYQLFLFFNYGSESDYTQKVRKLSKSFHYLTLQEEFLNEDNFYKIYSKASALVINSYRQHALGNIFTAILSGCKIYLNKKSSSFDWMKANHFMISEVSELKNDIKTGDIRLSKAEMEHNVNRYRQMIQEYSQKDFIKTVESILDND